MNESLKFKSGMDDSAFQRGLKNMEKGAAVAGAKIAGIGKGFATSLAGVTGLGALASGGAIFAGLKDVYDSAKNMELLSRQTGASVESLYLLKQATKESGLEMDFLATSMARMQKNLFTSEEAFKDIGLDAKTLKDESPAKAFIEVGNALANIANPAERSAAAIKIFGRSGTELLKAFLSPEFKSAGTVLSEKSKLMVENSEMFSEAANQLHIAGSRVGGFMVGLASEVTPSLLSAIKSFNSVDLVSKGKTFGSIMVGAVEAFKGGMVGAAVILEGMAKTWARLTKDLPPWMTTPMLFGQLTTSRALAALGGASKDTSNVMPEVTVSLKKDFWQTSAAHGPFQAPPNFSGRGAFPQSGNDFFFPHSTDFAPGQYQDSLQEWSKRMGVANSPYGAIESSTRVERHARQRAARDARDKQRASDDEDSESLTHAHHFVRSKSRNERRERLDLSKETIKELNDGTKAAVKEIVAE